jgi:hypothetical protein
MKFDLYDAIYSYNPPRYADLKCLIETEVRKNKWYLFISLFIGILMLVLIGMMLNAIYQFFWGSGDNANLLFAVSCLIALVVVAVLFNFFWHKADSSLLVGFRRHYPYTDSRTIRSLFAVEDFDFLFTKEVSDFQYKRLDFISSKNQQFGNKYKEIMAIRGGRFTKLDYDFMNCEKIYAEVLSKPSV